MPAKYEKPLLTEDHLIRMINLVLAALASAVGLKTAGQFQAAHEVVGQALEMVFGLRAHTLRALEDEALLDFLTVQDILDTDRLYMVAELFALDGALYREQNNPASAFWSELRALNFYLAVAAAGGAPHFDPPDERIDGLLERLAGYSLPGDTLWALFQYHESRRRYREAIAALAALRAVSDFPAEVEQERQAFLERLSALSDGELLQAGLSRMGLPDLLPGEDDPLV